MVQVHGFDLSQRVVYRHTGPFREPRQRHFAVIEQHALRHDACAAHTGGVLVAVEVEASHIATQYCRASPTIESCRASYAPSVVPLSRIKPMLRIACARAVHRPGLAMGAQWWHFAWLIGPLNHRPPAWLICRIATRRKPSNENMVVDVEDGLFNAR